MRKNMTRTEADGAIVVTALRLAQSHGYQNLSLRLVADAMSRSVAWVNRYFTAEQLRDRTLQAAIESRNYRVIAQGLAVKADAVMALPEDVRRKAAEALM